MPHMLNAIGSYNSSTRLPIHVYKLAIFAAVMKVGIIDYGLGNPKSIQNMIKKVGGDSLISKDHGHLSDCDKLILPGVGHFKQGMENLISNGLDQLIIEFAKVKPVLGICLGMQLLTEQSEEGACKGLGLIPLKTVRFKPSSAAVKVPHMGWADLQINKPHPYFSDVAKHGEAPRFYFVHSYFVENSIPENVIATCKYETEFAAVIVDKNVLGTQFHPEKSHRYGMQFFKNFLAG